MKFTKKIIKQEISKFFTDTSFTALSKIYKAQSIFRRTAWALVVIAMLTWLNVQCFWLLDKYFRYPIEVKLDLKASNELEFPSVTVCNMNPILSNRLFQKPFTRLKPFLEPPKDDTLVNLMKANHTFQAGRPCTDVEYDCGNNKCIRGALTCNGRDDCFNSKDEMDCATCRKGSFKCKDWCVKEELRCDGEKDCPQGEDEKNCEEYDCQLDYFKCSDHTCVPTESRCDGVEDCSDDEKNCTDSHGCSEGFKCADHSCLSIHHRCDGLINCNPGGEDEHNCKDHQCPEGYYKSSNNVCIPEGYVCDGVAQWPNGEDERDCEDYQCPEDSLKDSDNVCRWKWFVCNGIPDWPNGDDERDCEEFTCPEQKFKCSDNTCRHVISLCDGNLDCPQGDDEKNCNVTASCPEYFFSCPNEGRCIQKLLVRDGIKDCLNGADECGDCIRSMTTRPTPTAWTHSATKARPRRSPKKHPREKSNALDSGRDVFQRPESMWKSRREQDKGKHGYLTAKDALLKRRHLKGDVNARERSHKRRKRDITVPSLDYEGDEELSSFDWEQAFQAMPFTKWQLLHTHAKEAMSFYSERDVEWEAATTYSYITANLKHTALEYLGHNKDNFIASCEFNGYQCSPSNFTFVHNHKYGNCYTFNSKFSDGPILKTRFQGPENGLRLKLFIDQQSYVPTLATEAGARVVIHKRGTNPFPEDNGVSISPGCSTSIGLKQTLLSRLPDPHGNCADQGDTPDYYSQYMGTDYSKLSCLKSCYQDIAIQFCGCALPSYFVPPNTSVCNMIKKKTESCMSEMSPAYTRRVEECDELCPQPCEQTDYELSISSSLWPSSQYKEFLARKLKQTNHLYQNSTVHENFAKVQIYFEDLIYTHIEQNRAYESMNLISDLGGQLGLWLGLSAITIGELCSFLFTVGRSMTSTWFSGSETCPGNMTSHSSDLPAALAQIYEDLHPKGAEHIRPDKNHFRIKLHKASKTSGSIGL